MRFAEAAYVPQFQSQWCWAASVSMVFGFYGHPVAQDRIVAEAYGGQLVNLPAYGVTIAGQLNRRWLDDAGQPFWSLLTGAYDADARVYYLTNDLIIRELDENRPLIVGARSHAMVLTALQYYVTPSGPSIVAAGVFDPWPGVGPRQLAPDELVQVEYGGTLRFLATARVSSAGPVQPPPPPPPPREDPSMQARGCSVGAGTRADGVPVAGLVVLLLAGRRSKLRVVRGVTGTPRGRTAPGRAGACA
jgi:hypothetical protein